MTPHEEERSFITGMTLEEEQEAGSDYTLPDDFYGGESSGNPEADAIREMMENRGKELPPEPEIEF